MKKRSGEVIQDLRHFLTKGQIGFDFSNFKYYQMFCNVLEGVQTAKRKKTTLSKFQHKNEYF